MAGSNPPFRQWLGSMEPWQWAQCFDEGYRYGQMTTNLVEAINSILRHTRHLPISVVFSAIFSRLATLMPKMGLKQAKQLEAGHNISVAGRGSNHGPTELISETGDVSAGLCATYSLNAEQYIDDVYTLECMLHIWGNEFPVLRDVSTWEVQPPAFEMLPDRSLRRRIKEQLATIGANVPIETSTLVNLHSLKEI
ncbi:hypothetical protein GOBAR_AA37876 [Gossypium barbadense]|uniref:Uncharacterized protein n=1 Tax=Gossypium barbadense TaxID=3634 RepID=A0A2P5VVG8_GOSBA|nr:hypothetical protein GOBAR_AA37876 [Gossypium barbadense]